MISRKSRYSRWGKSVKNKARNAQKSKGTMLKSAYSDSFGSDSSSSTERKT